MSLILVYELLDLREPIGPGDPGDDAEHARTAAWWACAKCRVWGYYSGTPTCNKSQRQPCGPTMESLPAWLCELLSAAYLIGGREALQPFCRRGVGAEGWTTWQI